MKGNILLIIAITAFFITGCGDFDEGPGFSIRTKKARLANTWLIETVYLNDTLFSGSPVDSFYLDFDKKGEMKMIEVINTGGVVTYQTTKGNWDFIDVHNDAKIAFILESSDNPYDTDILIWEVLRLSKDEFWIAYVNDSEDEVQIYFTPK